MTGAAGHAQRLIARNGLFAVFLMRPVPVLGEHYQRWFAGVFA
jgi:hypothetical protein